MNKNLRTVLTALLVIVAQTGVVAQRYVVTGTARNAQSGTPLEYVSAALLRADSTVVSNGATGENGAFRLRAKGAGKFIVKLSYVGYKTLYRNVELTAARDSVSVGRLSLESAEKMLGTAVVSVTAARVEQNEDTTVFNASAYRVPEGSTLEALIEQLPGVEVTDAGTIKWNGKEIKEFLINGKDFFKGDTQIAMKNLPTELVSKIKAYDKKSDYTEMTGIDDGEETTVLDIATKRQLNESWISNVDLGYGTHDRYTGKLFLTRFTDTSRITAYGSANNVNDRGFGGRGGFGGGGGLTALKEAGLDFSWENGKKKREAGRFEVGGNVRYRHTSRDIVTASSSETFLSGGSSSSFSNSFSRSGSSSTDVNGGFRVQWSPDTMTNITFRPSFSHSSGKNDGDSRTATFNADPYEIEDMYTPLDSMFVATTPINPALAAIAVNRNQRLSLGDNENNSVNGSLNVTRRIGSAGRNVSLRASAGYSEGKNHSYSVSNIKYFGGQRDDSFLNQYSTTPSKNWNYSVRLGYVEPLGNQWFGELRYEYSHRYSDSDRSRYNLEKLGGEWADMEKYYTIGTVPSDELLNMVRDDYNSQYATYKYNDHRANIGIRHNTETIRFNAGVDFNPEQTDMEYVRPGQNIDTLITRNIFNVSPQIRFRYRFSKTTQLDIRYRGSSSQPSMTDLLAVVDDSDPLNVSMGNPGLKPSWTDNLRANYNSYNAERQQGIMAGLDFSRTRNSRSNRVVYDETTGVRYSRPENISGNWNGRADFAFNTGFGQNKTYTVSTYTNMSYSNSVGYISRLSEGGNSGVNDAASMLDGTYEGYNRIFSAAGSSKNTTRTLGVGEHLNLGYRTDLFNVGLNGSLNYQHARATLQDNANMDTWNFSYGANANLNLDWGMSISTDIRMSSRRGYSSASMNTDELIWNAQISQSFLKGKKATISLQFYDILHNQSNVSRTLSATMRSDSWNNAINSYVMVHFIYRLKIFAGKGNGGGNGGDKIRGGERRGPGGHGPGGGFRPMGRPF